MLEISNIVICNCKECFKSAYWKLLKFDLIGVHEMVHTMTITHSIISRKIYDEIFENLNKLSKKLI